MMNPLLGFVHEGKRNDEEEDPRERSTKKFKGKGLDGIEDNIVFVHSGAQKPISFKELFLGSTSESFQQISQEEHGVTDTNLCGEMQIAEHRFGEYECPEIILSEKEEERIAGPWRKGVIVKMLGKRIGYRALENRLNQMWARNGTISVVDLGNDYFMVSFTSDTDHDNALMEGPWLIYDHYLTVREWRPNFCPTSDAIEEIAVWVRISGLPLEYYDARVLSFIGNRIGQTVKVDRNTLCIERGKYARLCVQMDLTKLLLAMFSIKGRHYKIEYEGLHRLCMICGRFGHVKDGCGEFQVAHTPRDDGNTIVQKVNDGAANEKPTREDGPWVVVQKTGRNRRTSPHIFRDTTKKTAAILIGGAPIVTIQCCCF
ncbi:uncharacterized protein LOC131636537 [Vicia villosa]|uniref:uncharacterized protein LOC131636537 n=1 Tax=Vicia villosa TaxID=3911 RepID=UPI00273C2A83|nr:uncharacterized protein LOC131636537 [Vicia villosa]